MADPLSITASVVSLAAAAWKMSDNLRNLQSRFHRAPQTVSGLAAEFQATTAGLGQLSRFLESRQSAFLPGHAHADAAERLHLLQCLDAVIFDMARTFSLVDAELAKLSKDDASLFALRLRFLWVEGDLTAYMTQIRDQRSSLVFIMQSIQLAKIDDIHRQFHADSPGLSALKRTATRAKECRRPAAPVHQEAAPKPCVSDLADILRENKSFPDLDNLAPPPPYKPASPQQSPARERESRTGTSRAHSPAPGFESLNPGKANPYPQTAPGRPGLSPAATPRKVTPTLVFHELHFAVANNDIPRVLLLLDAGHDPLGLPHDPYGSLPNAKKTSLALAAYLGREEIMNIFLQRGFAWALNEIIGTDLPPFLAAAYAGHERMIRLLLDAGANPRLQGAGGTTGLFWASSRGHAHVVNLLMQTPARDDINLPGAKGLTSLMVAAQHGRSDVVRLLLSHGANPAALNAKRQSALHLACHAGHYESASLLLLALGGGGGGAQHDATINGATANGKTPLIFAALSGHPDVCRLLLQGGASAAARDAEGKTALYHASSRGHGDAVEALLAHASAAATIEMATPQGDNALHAACEAGHARVVGLLLAHGARLEAARASDGLSALGIAMWYARREVLAPLLLFKTQQDPRGYTREMALYAAAEWGLDETIDALLEAGADIDALDDAGGGGGQTPLARAVREGKVDAVRCLLAKGAQVDRPDRFGARPLHRAARGGNLAVAELLLSEGADVEGRDGKGLTPLHLAAVYGSEEMVEFLAGHGADIDALSGTEGDKVRETALLMAAAHGRADIVMKLVGLGAAIGRIDMYRKDKGEAMFIADADGRVEVVAEVVMKELVAIHADLEQP